MTSSLKPITLYGHAGGPNPWKVVIILEELALPYDHKIIDFSELSQEPLVSLCPNGRVPIMIDPNTSTTLWESGAIVEYLIAEYDVKHQISYDTKPEKYLTQQWLHFQMSEQGPYQGQLVFFQRYHSEKVESAIERYKGIVVKNIGVLEKGLKGKEYLVGDKATYADLSLMTWQLALEVCFGKEKVEELKKEYPAWAEWTERVMGRKAVKKMVEDRKAALANASK